MTTRSMYAEQDEGREGGDGGDGGDPARAGPYFRGTSVPRLGASVL